MKLLVQRVSQASVQVGGAIISRISRGMVVLVGIMNGDHLEQAKKLAQKLVALRIFPDEKGVANKSIIQAEGEILLVSQFTLCADTSRGNRPSYIDAMAPDQSEPFFNQFVDIVKTVYPSVKTGKFGAYMQVSLINDGPYTIMLER